MAGVYVVNSVGIYCFLVVGFCFAVGLQWLRGLVYFSLSVLLCLVFYVVYVV